MKFCEKNVQCEKGDEITRFDGISHPTAYWLTELSRDHITFIDQPTEWQLLDHVMYILDW